MENQIERTMQNTEMMLLLLEGFQELRGAFWGVLLPERLRTPHVCADALPYPTSGTQNAGPICSMGRLRRKPWR